MKQDHAFIACSLQGRDKGKIYFIVRREEKILYLADAAKWTCDTPKKKNRKHVSLVYSGYDSAQAKEVLEGPEKGRNERLRLFLQKYKGGSNV